MLDSWRCWFGGRFGNQPVKNLHPIHVRKTGYPGKWLTVVWRCVYDVSGNIFGDNFCQLLCLYLMCYCSSCNVLSLLTFFWKSFSSVFVCQNCNSKKTISWHIIACYTLNDRRWPVYFNRSWVADYKNNVAKFNSRTRTSVLWCNFSKRGHIFLHR